MSWRWLAKPVRESLSARCRNCSSTDLRSETTAARDNVITAMTPMKACRRRSDSFGVLCTKGPKPCKVPQMAIPDSTRIAVAASRCPKRNAAQMKKGTQRNANGWFLISDGKSPPKMVSPARERHGKRTAASRIRFRVHRTRRRALQSTSAGATTRSPTASPSHHVNQTDP